jgi:hypothetical protein
VGDGEHIVPPTRVKGLSLAVFEVGYMYQILCKAFMQKELTYWKLICQSGSVI